jgi:DNA-binding phage protein
LGWGGRDDNGAARLIAPTGPLRENSSVIKGRIQNTFDPRTNPYRRLRQMTKTGSFKELVQTRVKNDKKFAEALLREGIDAMLSGDVEAGKTILRDYIKATVGFEKLGEATGAPPKSLIRMFGPRGNPQAKNLFSVLGYLQKRAGLELHVA